MMLVFNSMDAYDAYMEEFNVCEFPCMVLGNDGYNMDMFVESKTWRGALRKFQDVFGKINDDINKWIDGMREAANDGFFKQSSGNTDTNNCFSYEIEDLGDNQFYIYLNLHGIYKKG